MQGVNVFCERCGSMQPKLEASTPRSAGVLARRVLDAVGLIDPQPRPGDDWLRLCLGCRGYSCPACWNEADGVCQTCAPLPEPVHAVAPEPVYVALPESEPVFGAELAPVYVAETEPAHIAQPEPQPVVVAEPAPEPLGVAEQVAEPVAVAEQVAEPVAVAEQVAEPVAVAEQVAEPVAVAELAPEPLAVAEQVAEPALEPLAVAEQVEEPVPEPVAVEPAAQPVTRPAPRMPILPLPPPRPADAPILPLPTLPAYPVAPQIAFSEQMSATASSAAGEPAYQQHSLLAPPADTGHVTSAGLRPCRKCELSLSARAHFCRRCGTAQLT